MANSRNTGGARALLFERLVDTELSPKDDWPPLFQRLVAAEPDQPGKKESPRKKESPPFRVLTREELRQSVKRELGQLLNSRCPVPLKLLEQEERTVINYGIPDFTSLSPQSADDRKLIASIIRQTITAFETRLRNVRVTAEYVEGDERRLNISVEADLVTETVVEVRSYTEFSSSVEPVSFPIVLNSKTGIMQII
jgi:type VI secretion system protein ImpF